MIQLKNVSKSFGNHTIFSNLSLTFEAGKVYALIGASGSGKTTLLNMIGKLEPYDGQIFYHQKELRHYQTTDFFRHELGYLFQQAGLIENESVDENLKLGLVGQKLTKQDRQRMEKEVLERVGLPYLQLEQPIFELSGGEAQRVALAKLILKDPPLILADEPTASVDPKNAQRIIDLLLSMRRSDRLIILATHSPSIWQMADEVVSMDE